MERTDLMTDHAALAMVIIDDGKAFVVQANGAVGTTYKTEAATGTEFVVNDGSFDTPGAGAAFRRVADMKHAW